MEVIITTLMLNGQRKCSVKSLVYGEVFEQVVPGFSGMTNGGATPRILAVMGWLEERREHHSDVKPIIKRHEKGNYTKNFGCLKSCTYPGIKVMALYILEVV